MSNISRAYADALFELSIEENILDETMERIRRMEELFDRLQSTFPLKKMKTGFRNLCRS